MTPEHPRKIPVVFYRTRGGTEVVRDWLRDLDEADRNAIGMDLMRIQYRWPVGMPLCRALGDGLWEARCRATVSPVCCSACIRGGYWRCMASLRRPRRRRTKT